MLILFSVSFTELRAAYRVTCFFCPIRLLLCEQKPNTTFEHSWRKHQVLTRLVREHFVEKYAIFRPQKWLLGGLMMLNVILQLVFME